MVLKFWIIWPRFDIFNACQPSPYSAVLSLLVLLSYLFLNLMTKCFAETFKVKEALRERKVRFVLLLKVSIN